MELKGVGLRLTFRKSVRGRKREREMGGGGRVSFNEKILSFHTKLKIIIFTLTWLVFAEDLLCRENFTLANLANM